MLLRNHQFCLQIPIHFIWTVGRINQKNLSVQELIRGNYFLELSRLIINIFDCIFPFSFVFLQLYHSSHFTFVDNDAKPILLPLSQTMIEKAVKNLDRIPPYEVHKVCIKYFNQIYTILYIILYSVWCLDWCYLCWVGTSKLWSRYTAKPAWVFEVHRISEMFGFPY